jgi:regulator of protease activity HflC (stomatin/prohibitin superfamily)
VRAVVARSFGELTAESIYNAGERNAKAAEMLKTLNRELEPQHIEVLAITPRDVRFFSAYEEIIKKKKIKDQETQQYLSEARLAEQRQRTEVAQAEFEAKQSVQRAEGEADKVRAEADGYAKHVAIEADGELSKALKEAEGQLAIGLAEAQGIKEQAAALGGAGGVNLVALAYAKKLATFSISGIPVMQDPTQGNVRVQQIGAIQSSPQTNAAPPQGPELPPGIGVPPGGKR